MTPGPIRVLILTDTPVLAAGGSERFLRNLAARLDPARYELDVVQLAEEPAAAARVGALPDHCARALTYMPVGAIYRGAGLRALLALRRRVRARRYDIVQSQHEKSDLIAALLPRGPVRISNRRDMGFQKSARLRRLFRVLNGRYDRIVAPSAAILDALEREDGADRSRLRLIGNGVDCQRFRPHAADERAAIRDELGLPREAIVFACVASFTPVKRHADLLDAFARVRFQQPRAHLLLAGDGPLHADVTARAAAPGVRGAVTIVGNRPDVERLLGASDAFVLASSTEGLSNALLEAMAAALPVVATRVGGNPDLVRPGETGLLVPALEPAALAEAMTTLAGDATLRQRLGAAGRARVLADFSLDAMARGYDALYRELLDERAR
jgi:glycosyltransferase involved in cell wall biosynthesis